MGEFGSPCIIIGKEVVVEGRVCRIIFPVCKNLQGIRIMGHGAVVTVYAQANILADHIGAVRFKNIHMGTANPFFTPLFAVLFPELCPVFRCRPTVSHGIEDAFFR